MLLNGEDPQYAINFASAVGAIVAQNEGANPVISSSEIDDFLSGFDEIDSKTKEISTIHN